MSKIVTKEIKGKVVSYEYRGKKVNYDASIQLRIEKDKKDKLINLSKELGYEYYSVMLKEIIDSYLEKHNLL